MKEGQKPKKERRHVKNIGQYNKYKANVKIIVLNVDGQNIPKGREFQTGLKK